MVDYGNIEQRLSETLDLPRRPIAVTFRDTPPMGVPKFTGTEPSGCSFWRLAAEGRTFYTAPQSLGQYLLVDYASNRKKRMG